MMSTESAGDRHPPMSGKYDREADQQTRSWNSPVGSLVEVRLDGKIYRQGIVDDVMPDASGVWIASDGVHSREYIERRSGYELRLLLTRTSSPGASAVPSMRA